MRGVYLLCLSPGVRHARHYIGWADDVERRVAQHVSGRGAALTRAAVRIGCAVAHVRSWDGADRNFERRLKRRKNAAGLCPRCRPGYNGRAAASMRRVRLRRAVAS